MSQNNSLVPIRFALGTVSSFGNSAYQIAAEKDIMKRGRDYIGVGVGAVIVDSKGRLLLVLRGPKQAAQENLP